MAVIALSTLFLKFAVNSLECRRRDVFFNTAGFGFIFVAGCIFATVYSQRPQQSGACEVPADAPYTCSTAGIMRSGQTQFLGEFSGVVYEGGGQTHVCSTYEHYFLVSGECPGNVRGTKISCRRDAGKCVAGMEEEETRLNWIMGSIACGVSAFACFLVSCLHSSRGPRCYLIARDEVAADIVDASSIGKCEAPE
uniref:Uncharacterized protein n=1 Tax=Karlodinium veneficum TaxID=407301 RepID=A7WPZ3_KARVE|nr:unknown [Karlodinium veneficum]